MTGMLLQRTLSDKVYTSWLYTVILMLIIFKFMKDCIFRSYQTRRQPGSDHQDASLRQGLQVPRGVGQGPQGESSYPRKGRGRKKTGMESILEFGHK